MYFKNNLHFSSSPLWASSLDSITITQSRYISITWGPWWNIPLENILLDWTHQIKENTPLKRSSLESPSVEAIYSVPNPWIFLSPSHQFYNVCLKTFFFLQKKQRLSWRNRKGKRKMGNFNGPAYGNPDLSGVICFPSSPRQACLNPHIFVFEHTKTSKCLEVGWEAGEQLEAQASVRGFDAFPKHCGAVCLLSPLSLKLY